MKKDYVSPEVKIIIVETTQDVIMASWNSVIGGENDLPIIPTSGDDYNT